MIAWIDSHFDGGVWGILIAFVAIVVTIVLARAILRTSRSKSATSFIDDEDKEEKDEEHAKKPEEKQAATHDDAHGKKDDHGHDHDHGHGNKNALWGGAIGFILLLVAFELFRVFVFHKAFPDFNDIAFGNPPPGTYATRTVTQTETVSRQAVPNASATVIDCSVYHDTVTLPANGDWTGPNPVYARCKPKLSISDADSIMDIEYLDLQGHWVGKDVQYVYDGRVINGVPKDYTALRFRRKCTLKGSDGTPDSTEVNLCRAPLDSQQPPEPITFSINFIPYDTA